MATYATASPASGIRSIRERGALSLVDCKRCDVIDTMEGYADSMLGEDSGFYGDAMTVTAYLGFEALRPAFDRALACGTAVFVVVHSSNSDGRSVQNARRSDGKTVAEALADDITAFNAVVEPEIGPISAVVGATIDTSDTRILSRLSRSLILAPGVGAQGATMADVGRKFAEVIDRTLPSVSRSILHHGPSSTRIRGAIDRYRDEAWLALEKRGSVVL